MLGYAAGTQLFKVKNNKLEHSVKSVNNQVDDKDTRKTSKSAIETQENM